MVELEYHIGFPYRPDGIQDFLEREGYVLTYSDEDHMHFEQDERTYPEIFYFRHALESKVGEKPDWERHNYLVASEMRISTRDIERNDMLEDIATKLVKRYGAVLYDPMMDAYYPPGQY